MIIQHDLSASWRDALSLRERQVFECELYQLYGKVFTYTYICINWSECIHKEVIELYEEEEYLKLWGWTRTTAQRRLVELFDHVRRDGLWKHLKDA